MIQFKKFKKGLSVTLAILMVLTILPVGTLKAEAAESDNKTRNIVCSSITHCVTVNGLAPTTDVNCSVNGEETFSDKTDSDGKLYLWMPMGSNKVTICCKDIYYGVNATVSNDDVSTDAGVMTVLDESKKNIQITESTVSGKDVGNVDVTVPNPYGYVITCTRTAAICSATISGGTHNIVLKGLTADDSNSGLCPVSITGSASVYLTLCGTNTLKGEIGCLEVTQNASAFLTGTDNDSLQAICIGNGAGGAGIGGSGNPSNLNCGTVKIAGGTITANGAPNCAGIGGGYGGTPIVVGAGGNITVSGGTVNANSGNGGAGIGGGFGAAGGQVSITGGKITASSLDGGAGIGGGYTAGGGGISISGGTVTATVAKGTTFKQCGAGIGDGYFGNGSTVEISGGSVNIPNISSTPTSDGTTPVYPTTVVLPAGTNIDSLSITQSSDVSYGTNDMQADGGEMLHLYLPAYEGDTIVNVTVDDTAFSGYHGKVKSSGTQATPNTLKMNQSNLSFVDTGIQTFTYGDTIALNKAVTGGTLSGTVSYTYSGTDKKWNTIFDSTECPTNAGDDYTVTAILPGNAYYYDATAKKHFTIMQKDIGTNGVSIWVGTKTYSGGELSPNITVTQGPKILIGGTDYKVCDATSGLENPTYTNAGDCMVKVIGIGNYTGTALKTFVIAHKRIDLTLAASQNSAKAGDTVTLTATVQNAVSLPAGTVQFKYNGTMIASGNITQSNGKYMATVDWSNVPAGEHNITAEYVSSTGDNYLCSDHATISGYSIMKYDQTGFGFQDETISKTYGDDIFSIPATGGQGSGEVTYESSDENVATVIGNGVVTIKNSGTVTITAKKASDSTYNETVDSITINIGKAATSIQTVPTASEIAVVGKLSSAALENGTGSVAGAFHWINPDIVVSKDGEYEVAFIPTSSNYLPCTCKVAVKVTPVITNSGTGIQYDLRNTNLPNGVTSVSVQSSAVPEGGSESSAYSIVNKLIGESTLSAFLSEVKLYNLSLIDQKNQAVAGFTGKIMVKIPIPSGMNGDLHVYWYNNTDGTVTDMNAKQENGYLVFETTHFSFYAIAKLSAKSAPGPVDSTHGTTPNPDTGSGSFPLIPAMLLGISACGLVVVTKGRRFRKKNG